MQNFVTRGCADRAHHAAPLGLIFRVVLRVGFEGGPCGALGGSIFNFLPPSFLQRTDIRLGKAWGDSKIPGVALSVQKQNALIGAFLYVPKPSRPTGGPPIGTGNEVNVLKHE